MSRAGEPTDEATVAALLAALAVVRASQDAEGPARAFAADALRRWRAQRMAALAGTGSDGGAVAASTPSPRPAPGRQAWHRSRNR